MSGSPFVPPPRQPQFVADPTELLALRVIVMALVAREANTEEALGNGSAQGFVNLIAAACQEALIASNIENESIRAGALDHINAILGGISYPPNVDQTN